MVRLKVTWFRRARPDGFSTERQRRLGTQGRLKPRPKLGLGDIRKKGEESFAGSQQGEARSSSDLAVAPNFSLRRGIDSSPKSL